MLIYKHETPSLEDIRGFFYRTDSIFDIPLSEKVNIEEYTLKLYTYADFFVCYDDDRIVGMICCYMNRPPEAFISHVCVSSEYQGKGIFKTLFNYVVDQSLEKQFTKILLEVSKLNKKAQTIYCGLDFVVMQQKDNSYIMKKTLV